MQEVHADNAANYQTFKEKKFNVIFFTSSGFCRWLREGLGLKYGHHKITKAADVTSQTMVIDKGSAYFPVLGELVGFCYLQDHKNAQAPS